MWSRNSGRERLPRRERLVDNMSRLKELVLEGRELMEGLRPCLDEFIDGDQEGYSEEDVEADKNKVSQKQTTIMTDTGELDKVRMVAELLEIIFADQADRSLWLGEGFESFPASTYDDLFNGVDTILEFFGDEYTEREYFGLGFDVTLASDLGVIRRKIEKIIETNEKLGLSKVKYFKPFGSDRYGLKLPKVIVGCDFRHVNDIATMWAGLRNEALTVESRKSLRTKIANHPIQFLFIEVILVQLKFFSNLYRKKVEKGYEKYTEAAERYELLLEIFEKLKVDRKNDYDAYVTKFVNSDGMLGSLKRVILTLENNERGGN